MLLVWGGARTWGIEGTLVMEEQATVAFHSQCIECTVKPAHCRTLKSVERGHCSTMLCITEQYCIGLTLALQVVALEHYVDNSLQCMGQ